MERFDKVRKDPESLVDWDEAKKNSRPDEKDSSAFSNNCGPEVYGVINIA